MGKLPSMCYSSESTTEINLLSNNLCSWWEPATPARFLVVIGCLNRTVWCQHIAGRWWRQTAHLEKDSGFHEVSDSDVTGLLDQRDQFNDREEANPVG